jgi:hypothetical protein
VGSGEGVRIDQDVVGPGETFTCTLPLTAPTTYARYNEYFSPVTEDKGWMFNDGRDDVYAPLAVADASHTVWAPGDYAAKFIDQSGPTAPMAPGGSGTLTFTFRNSGVATFYDSGSHQVDCRGTHPLDRASAWIDPAGANVVSSGGQPQGVTMDQTKVDPGHQFTCTIPLKAPAAHGLQSNEYFSPVAENETWIFNNGHDDVYYPLSTMPGP